MMTFQFRRSGQRHSVQTGKSEVLRKVMLATGIVVSMVSFSNASAETVPDQAKRGEYLATAGNCVSCHTSKNGSPFAGGLPFETPFGKIYSTNITSDPDAGIGRWTLEEFTAAMRQGKRPNGDHLYPVFPYTSYTKVSDEDIAAIYAYLKTVSPVKYTPPENELGFPFNQRWTLGLWKALFFKEGQYEPQPAQSAEWNRGAYLVEGLGHCGMCHTPRNFMGAPVNDLALAGGTYTTRFEGRLSSWSASNLTSATEGLAKWSVDDVTDYLKLGISSRSGVFGPMNEVVVNSTRHLSREDVRAMAVYLKSLPAKSREATGGRPADDVVRAGSLQYDIHCGSCHLPTGEGAADQGPPLIGSPVVLDADPSSLINVTLFGAQTPHVAPSTEWEARRWIRMEPFENKLSDEQAAALLSFVRNAWGHEASAVTPEQVAAQR